jgi:hypothetical protein
MLSEEEMEELEQGRPDFVEVWGGGRFNWPREIGKVSLRNLNSLEYITDRLFPGMFIFLRHRSFPGIFLTIGIEVEKDHPALSQALLTKISWSRNPSMAIPWHPNWHRGTWAGARIGLVLTSEMEDIEQWKDITEETFMDYWKFAIRDGCIDKDCECQLCVKYRQMYENKIQDRKGKEEQGDSKATQALTSRDHGTPNVTKKTKNEIKYKPSSYQGISNIKESKRFRENNRLSTLEKFPYEIFDLISSQLPCTSLAACALTSTSLYSLVVKRLYTSVDTLLYHFTRMFAETLMRRPFICDFVRDLSIGVKPHWKSVGALHEVLKRLTRLTSLHLLPSWVSYGDLPYWEYPFKLRKIKWGLMKDRASQKFIASQSDTFEYLKLDTT